MSRNWVRSVACILVGIVLAGCGTGSAPVASTTPPPVTRASAGPSALAVFASASPAAARRLRASGASAVALGAMPHARATAFPQVTVVGDVDERQMADINGYVSQAVHDVSTVTGARFSRELLVLAPRSEAEFARIYGSSNVADIQADTVIVAGKQPYIVFNAGRSIQMVSGPSATSTMPQVNSAQVSRKVLTHEVFHALTLTYAARRHLPLWLTEGFAEWAGQKFSGLHLTPKAKRAALPSNADMSGSNAVDAYQVATSFVRYIVKTCGQRKAIAFYSKAVVHPTGSLAALAERELGHSMPTLVAGWQHAYQSSR
ncbi:hypothetical protein [Leekyejoonella antrihumi]|uniref:Peptidase MA-like domain-containing protein n=1 Tax=Leekyejoonella antrihumi TaxID=1660198 RepID=A0A563DWQ0_9MICO|nr:hypothetical protein [Leekyejoonella antrihumi]TWP34718.1 hypothetical protein FGL98_16550 [Leekyejoonella antrihumi]